MGKLEATKPPKNYVVLVSYRHVGSVSVFFVEAKNPKQAKVLVRGYYEKQHWRHDDLVITTLAVPRREVANIRFLGQRYLRDEREAE